MTRIADKEKEREEDDILMEISTKSDKPYLVPKSTKEDAKTADTGSELRESELEEDDEEDDEDDIEQFLRQAMIAKRMSAISE